MAVTRLDPERHVAHRFPYFLPDGRRYLFWVSGDPEVNGIYFGDLDSDSSGRITNAEHFGGFAPPDLLLHGRGDTLFSQRLDLTTFQLVGEPRALTERIARDGTITFRAAVSASRAGPIAYRAFAPARQQLAWLDRSGRQLGVLAEFDTDDPASGVRLAPDGRLAALRRRVNGATNIWFADTTRGLLRRLTADPAGLAGAPSWSPDGAYVGYDSNRRGIRDLFRRPFSEGAAEELLLETQENKNVSDWSLDGRFILYINWSSTMARDVWALPLDDARKPVSVVQTPADETGARFSPDGRWISYSSNETGRSEIYIHPFPGSGPSSQVSTGGGSGAVWRADGREIYYVQAGRLMAVPIGLSAGGRDVEIGSPQALFVLGSGAGYEPARDGQRFLVNRLMDDDRSSPISILLNWVTVR
ncbi:MAG: PD40 domain-containing protein [Acidobacteria bacterium]|nr:PD40 domain-containing protein [Acidobacteriota bacterium]